MVSFDLMKGLDDVLMTLVSVISVTILTFSYTHVT
jgi:hypothetical protein